MSLRIFVIYALSMLSVSTALAEPRYFLRSGHISCPSQNRTALEKIVDATDDEQLKAALYGAVYTGACTGAVMAQMPVTSVKEIKSKKSNSYYCFSAVSIEGKPEDNLSCTLRSHVTSVEREINERRGDYQITLESPKLLKVECVEGGFFFMRKQEDTWERMSLVFPVIGDPPSKSVLTRSVEELRNGCLGIDYAN